ncbi:MAG: hypothetical protein HY926_11380 [Elusimicrobia bacterium]|nr:hypothetical protein [Elusimicrobiota bacterium]
MAEDCRPGRWAKDLDLLVCLGLWGFSLHIHWPGFMTVDSITQLTQAQLGQYGDWHPAVMSLVWRWLNRLHFGPGSMLVFHNLLFFGALACLARATRWGPGGRSLLLVLASAVPSVFTQLGVIWKDTGLAASYFLSFSWLVLARGRGWPVLPVLLPLFYGTAVRHNSLPALVPLALLFVDAAAPGLKSSGRKLAAALALALCLWGLASWVNRRLADGHREHLGVQLVFFDLAGISVCRDTLLYPPGLNAEEVTLAKVRERYHPGDWTPPPNVCFSPRIGLPGFGSAAERFWLRQVLRHPACYLRHRLSVFIYALNLDGGDPTIPICCRVFPNPWGIRKARSPAFERVYGLLWSIRNSLWFHVYPYFLACGLALILALRRRDLALGCLSASGFLYCLGYAVVGVGSDDFRLSYWTVLASVASAVWLASSLPDWGRLLRQARCKLISCLGERDGA